MRGLVRTLSCAFGWGLGSIHAANRTGCGKLLEEGILVVPFVRVFFKKKKSKDSVLQLRASLG